MQELARPSFPALDRDAHKHARGRLLVVAGSIGLAGAARLAGAAALRTGCGLVRLAVPLPVRAECAADAALMVEGMAATLSGAFAFRALPLLVERCAQNHACVLGPGLGLHEETVALLRALVPRLTGSLVLDADALNALAGAPLPRHAGAVWTPHAAEAARLLGCTLEEVQGDRVAAARELVRLTDGVVVLKGRGTLVADGDGVQRCSLGNPGLARGGSGDVLAGTIGALLAAGLAPHAAACTAVWVHAAAADRVAAAHGERCMTPQDVIDALVPVIQECSSHSA